MPIALMAIGIVCCLYVDECTICGATCSVTGVVYSVFGSNGIFQAENGVLCGFEENFCRHICRPLGPFLRMAVALEFFVQVSWTVILEGQVLAKGIAEKEK